MLLMGELWRIFRKFFEISVKSGENNEEIFEEEILRTNF